MSDDDGKSNPFDKAMALAAKQTGLCADDDEMEGMEPDVQEVLRHDVRPGDLVLPNDFVSYPYAARRLFTQMAQEREVFTRGHVMVELVQDDDGQRLEIVTAAKLCSRIDGRGRRVKAVRLYKNAYSLHPKRCSAHNADVMLNSQEVGRCLPRIELIAKVPVLVEVDSQLQTLGPGYHEAQGGILVLGTAAVPVVAIKDAVPRLLALLEDFKFTGPADRSRAIAGFIGPALRSGRLLEGHALVNAIEADKSQTGKGFLLALQQAVYGEVPTLISQTSGGVGSLDEKLAAALIQGRTFVALDNLRGRIASQYLESIITAHKMVGARVPHRGEVFVDIRSTTFQLTSNGAEGPPDFGNRLLLTRLLHQGKSYKFRRFDEGGLLQHVRAHQPFYLGCVHAVIRAWHEAGKPQPATDHSFKEWTGALHWIVTQVFKLPPLLDGHDTAVERVANPALTWLRAVALAAVENGREGHGLTAKTLVRLCDEHQIDIPGMRAEATDDKALMVIGGVLGRCFKEGDLVVLDSIKVRRWNYPWVDDRSRTTRRYQFWRGDQAPPEPRNVYGDASSASSGPFEEIDA